MMQNILSKMFLIFEVDEMSHYQTNKTLYWERKERKLIEEKEFVLSLLAKKDIFEVLLLLNLIHLLGNKEYLYILSWEIIEEIRDILNTHHASLPTIKQKIMDNMNHYRFQFDLITGIFDHEEI